MNNKQLASVKPNTTTTSSSRKRRSTSSSAQCQQTYFGRIAFASKSSDNLLTTENLKSMCYLEKKIMKSSPSKYDKDYLGGCPNCCTSFSLGSVVAQLSNKSKCENINDNDVKKTVEILTNCSVYLVKGLLRESCDCNNLTSSVSQGCSTVPCICSWKKIVYNTFHTLVDSEFLKTPSQTKLKYSAILSPTTWTSNDLYRNIFDSHFKEKFPEYKDVKVVGFDFGRFRFVLFNSAVIENMKFPAIAMAFVILFMWFFLNSFMLSLLSMLTVIFALVLSYFLYSVAFGIKFFPFLNVATLIFIVGIGADDAFVYYDIFRQTKSANPNDSLLTLTIKTLRVAALSMFVTSFTTSAAFFANVTSHISSIKTFGIFAGLSILTNYLLMITWFPIIVILHERWVRKNKIDQIVTSSKEEKIAPIKMEIIDRNGSAPKKETETSKRSLCCLICWAIDFPCHFFAKNKSFLSKASQKVFNTWLPNAIIKKRLYFLWIFLATGLTVGFACVCLVSPGLQLPSTSDFQIFSSRSLIEQYNLHIKKNFRYATQELGNMQVELVWGIKPRDNGNFLDPDDKGTLEYDGSFDSDYTTEASQKWFSSICKSLESQKFFSGDISSWRGGSLCSIETINRKCSAQTNKPSCCKANTNFPFPKDVIDGCMTDLKLAKPVIYYEKSTPKILKMYFYSNVFWTAQYKPMDTFWNQIDNWSKKHFSEAPTPFKSGWVVSRRLYRMYSVQWSLEKGTVSSLGIAIGIAFGVMLLTTLNIFISVYAIITIIGIIAMTVGCLVLLGWELSVLESIVISVAVGLSIDFTMHYGVAYRLSTNKEDRKERVRYSLIHIGSAIFMAAFTTFITGTFIYVINVFLNFFNEAQATLVRSFAAF